MIMKMLSKGLENTARLAMIETGEHDIVFEYRKQLYRAVEDNEIIDGKSYASGKVRVLLHEPEKYADVIVIGTYTK